MGNLFSVPNFTATIRTKDGKKFATSYHSLVEHILLLRKVINNPDMTTQGPLLDYFIKDYCKRMAQDEMKTKEQQLKLPWQIEWIWHVHRLHPLAYLNDCNKQLSDGLVDKKVREFIKTYDKTKKAEVSLLSIRNDRLFVPSIELMNAVIRQKGFLNKFQKHALYSHQFSELDKLYFQKLVQNYVSFIKLAGKNQLIVPTFDIDLMWHTHMRFPSHYHEVSKALCGFIVDHDDSIESNVLTDAYKKTADRWKQIYHIEYGQNIDRKYLETTQLQTSCAVVSVPHDIDSTYYGGCGGSGCASGVMIGDGVEYRRYRIETEWTSDGDSGGDGDGGGCGGCGGD